MKKLSTLIATILVFALTMSTFAGSFSDVPENHWAYEAIVELYNLGIYEGYPDGTFKGDNAMTRYEMALVITRTLENIDKTRQETAAQVEELEQELADLQMSLTGTEQLADLRDSITQKEIDKINEKLDNALAQLEEIEAIQQELDDLQMSLTGTEQLADLRNSVMQKELDALKAQVEEIKANVGNEDGIDADVIASLEEKIEAVKKSGLNTEEAQDVTAIVRAMLKENSLDKSQIDVQTEEVIANLQALIEEFDQELADIEMSLKGTEQLADLRHSIMEKRVDDLDARVVALEEEEPVVTFSGEYGVDLNSVSIYGDALEAEEGEKYYYKDPYDAQSGWYKEDVDADTDNDNGSKDYRLTDEEDYYDDDFSFTNTLDLNIGVNKGALSADLNMVAFENSFVGDDTVGYELDSLGGTITANEFKATIKDGQEVSFKDYLFNESTVDGVVVEYKDDVYFLSHTTEAVEESAYDLTNDAASYIVDGDDDDVLHYDRNWFRAGANTNLDLVLPINVYVGYEYTPALEDEVWLDADDEEVDNSLTADADEVKTALVALDTATTVGGFDVTSDLAFNLGESSNKGHLFRLGAAGELSLLDVEFNYENTADMILIEEDADADKEGYDLTLGSTFGPVEGSWTREDYSTDVVADTIKAEVPAGEVAFAGIDVDGSYELTIKEDDSRNEIRNINAATELSDIALSYTYDYDVDNEIYDEEKDRVDNGVADDPTEEDDDVNKHTVAATYGMGNFTAGAKAEMEKAVASDDNEITFENEFTNTYTFTGDYENGPVTSGVEHVINDDSSTETTLTARYTQDMYEAGIEKVLDGDLTIDGSVTAPTLTLASVNIDSNASFKRNVDAETQNLELNVDATKDVNEKLALNSGFTWADKEIDVDFAGQKTALNAGVDYSITSDITANADFNYLKFDADSGESYKVKEATAGVNIAF